MGYTTDFSGSFEIEVFADMAYVPKDTRPRIVTVTLPGSNGEPQSRRVTAKRLPRRNADEYAVIQFTGFRVYSPALDDLYLPDGEPEIGPIIIPETSDAAIVTALADLEHRLGRPLPRCAPLDFPSFTIYTADGRETGSG